MVESGNYILLFYLISYVIICRATNMHHSQFTEKPLKANQLFNTGRLLTTTTSSLRGCTILCSYSKDCLSVVYHSDGQCYLFNNDFDAIVAPGSDLLGAKFYVLHFRQMVKYSNTGKSQICLKQRRKTPILYLQIAFLLLISSLEM